VNQFLVSALALPQVERIGKNDRAKGDQAAKER
jgi:hypothetical protein